MQTAWAMLEQFADIEWHHVRWSDGQFPFTSATLPLCCTIYIEYTSIQPFTRTCPHIEAHGCVVEQGLTGLSKSKVCWLKTIARHTYALTGVPIDSYTSVLSLEYL